MDKKLSLSQLVWIGTGHVIGAGVVSIVGSALAVTGFSVWLAFAFTCVLSFIRVLPFVFFTSAIQAEGGKYAIITGCAGEKYGGLITISSLLSWAARGTAVLALSGYVSDFIPGAPGKLIATGVWALFCFANLFGVNAMSRIQNLATPLLLAALVFFSVVCTLNIQPGYLDFSSPYMFLNGKEGFMTAVVLLSYSCDGVASLANYMPYAKNPKKNIPRAIIAVSAVISVVYISVGFASGAVLPLSETAGKTLAVTAKAVFSPAFYGLFILFGPVFALLTTMNAGIIDSAAPVMAGVKDGWLPAFLASQNRYGAYYVAVAVIFVIGCIPTVFGFSISQIAGITMVLNSMAAVLLIISCVNFPFVYKKEWEESEMYIPPIIYFPLIFLCAVMELFVVILALKELTAPMAIANGILLAVRFIYGSARNKSRKKNNVQNKKAV